MKHTIKHKKSHLRQANSVIALCLACIVSVTNTIGVVHASSSISEINDNLLLSKYGDDSYELYRSLYQNDTNLGASFLITPENLNESSVNVHLKSSGGADGNRIAFDEASNATYSIQVPTSGYYLFQISYSYINLDKTQNSTISILVDGKLPYFEAKDLTLTRIWQQDTIVHKQNGNDVTPNLYQSSNLSVFIPGDIRGYYGDYKFYLTQGTHTVTIESEQGGFSIGKIYATTELTKAQANLPMTGDIQIIQAENLYSKNDSSILPGTDRSDAAVMPNDPVLKKLNVIDGKRFLNPTQKATWQVTVPQDGRYRIAFRFLQNSVQGLFVSRRLWVDDIPMPDDNIIQFPYGDEWQYQMAVDAASKDLWIDLTKGTHTISLEATLGKLQGVVRRMDDAVYVLNSIYRSIIMITGISPDSLRDYSLDKEIPELLNQFQRVKQELDDIYHDMQTFGIKGGQVSILKQISNQLASFIEKPYDIPNRLDSYKGNVSSLSAFIMSLQQQPLSLDEIALIGDETTSVKRTANFWELLWFQIQAFLGSFTNDYSTFANADDSLQPAEVITAWFNGGREQAELLKSIIDDQFTVTRNIGVNLQLVTLPVTQAVLAGTAPDVYLNLPRSQPVNLGARGVLKDLTDLKGFSQIADQFDETYLQPYSWNNAVYGMPITLDHFVVFYRKDIFKELNLSVPTTWTDFYKMIPVLQRNNMAIGLPYTVLSTQSTIESGIGAKDLFATMLLQHNISLYSDDGKEILLDDNQVVEVFREWTSFYTKYQFDLEFNFYNRFRTGEMPIAIQSYTAYNLLSSAAPEIKGLWDMALLPGVLNDDGTINKATAASGTAAVMLKDTPFIEESWEFLQWWSSASAQTSYGNALETLMGKASRYNPANVEALKNLPWSNNERDLLLKQRSFIKEIPEVLGGYYTVRGIDNAFRNVVYSNKHYKESLSVQNGIVNTELKRKQNEIAKLGEQR